MKCMPVCVIASTRASASSLGGTASRKSRVKDIHLFPLDVSQMQAVISNLVERVAGAPKMPSALPTRATQVLQLIGGNPRMLSQALCSMAGNHAVTQAFPAGRGNEQTVGCCNLSSGHVQQLERLSSISVKSAAAGIDGLQLTHIMLCCSLLYMFC